jgi:hypothetical protein
MKSYRCRRLVVSYCIGIESVFDNDYLWLVGEMNDCELELNWKAQEFE